MNNTLTGNSFAPSTPYVAPPINNNDGTPISVTLIGQNSLVLGVTESLALGDIAQFSIASHNYYFTLNSVSSSVANVGFGGGNNSNLNLAQEKKFDLNGDGYYDLLLRFDSFSNQKANIFVKMINEAYLPVSGGSGGNNGNGSGNNSGAGAGNGGNSGNNGNGGSGSVGNETSAGGNFIRDMVNSSLFLPILIGSLCFILLIVLIIVVVKIVKSGKKQPNSAISYTGPSFNS